MEILDKKWVFRVFNKEGRIHFESPLVESQCQNTDSAGNRCLILTSRLYPYCYSCTLKIYNVAIAQSSLGKKCGYGLFAYDPEKKSGDIVFKPGQYIAPYHGETVTEKQMVDRYCVEVTVSDPPTVAPYGYTLETQKHIDGALIRGPAVYANDHPGGPYNCEFREKPHLCIIATENIYQHDEIFLNYGENYWDGTHLRFETVYE